MGFVGGLILLIGSGGMMFLYAHSREEVVAVPLALKYFLILIAPQCLATLYLLFKGRFFYSLGVFLSLLLAFLGMTGLGLLPIGLSNLLRGL